MTQPYYTALPQTGNATAGPADPNASTRVKSYTVFSALLGLIPVLTIFKVITQDQGVAIGNASQALIGLAGAFGFAFVAKKTNDQVKNGTFDPAPVVEVAPAHTAIEGIKAVQSQAEELFNAVAGGVGMVQDAAKALGSLSGMMHNPLTDDFLNRP